MGANITSASSETLSPEDNRTINYFNTKKKICSHKLSTLKRRLVNVKNGFGLNERPDYGKYIRDLVSQWSPMNIYSLLDDFEALASLKELNINASHARTPITTLSEQLGHILVTGETADVELIYAERLFFAHRVILCARSPYFRNLFSSIPPNSNSIISIRLSISTPGIDADLFKALLNLLYTGECGLESKCRLRPLLSQLAVEFGIPGKLEDDIKVLIDTGLYADAIISFTNENLVYDVPASANHLRDIPCHQVILAARSPFFKSLILRLRYQRQNDANKNPLRIVIDTNVIPFRYSDVLLSALYSNVVDFSSVSSTPTSPSKKLSPKNGFLKNMDRDKLSIECEAMELFQVGQFLEMVSLSRACEDVIIENMTLNNLTCILSWSQESHGSRYVQRHAFSEIQENFVLLSKHPALLMLTEKDWKDGILSSDFVNAPEHIILEALLKWGEAMSCKIIDLPVDKIKSTTSKSPEELDLSQILSKLAPLIRCPHLLPTSEAYTAAIRRGVLTQTHSCRWAQQVLCADASVWVRLRGNNSAYRRPRYCSAYHEELKKIVDSLSKVRDKMSTYNRRFNSTCNCNHQYSPIPDALYMVKVPSSAPTCVQSNPLNSASSSGSQNISVSALCTRNKCAVCRLHFKSGLIENFNEASSCTNICSNPGCNLNLSVSSCPISKASGSLDVLAGVNKETDKLVLTLHARELELLQQNFTREAASIINNASWAISDNSHLLEIVRFVRLRIVREFGLPDISCELFKSDLNAFIRSVTRSTNHTSVSLCCQPSEKQCSQWRMGSTIGPGWGRRSPELRGRSGLRAVFDRDFYLERRQFFSEEESDNLCNATLDYLMPDIALETRSISRLQINQSKDIDWFNNK